ncbi:hypothetical protein Tco_1076008, partial [Tanacetum coccineum]
MYMLNMLSTKYVNGAALGKIAILSSKETKQEKKGLYGNMKLLSEREWQGCSDRVGFYSLLIDVRKGSMLSVTHVYITYEEMRATAINTLSPQRTAMTVDSQYWRIIALYMYLNMMVMCRYQCFVRDVTISFPPEASYDEGAFKPFMKKRGNGPSSFLLLRLRNSWIFSTIKLQRERNRVEPAKKISLIKCRYMRTFRKSIGAKIKEEAKFIEGKVVEIQIDH